MKIHLGRLHRYWRHYLKSAGDWNQQSSYKIRLPQLLRYFPRWYKYLQDGHNSIIDEQPWLSFPAINALARILRNDSRVFEWGMGGSSLFLAQRAQEVTSVEHDRDWYERTQQEMTRRKTRNWRGLLVDPEPAPNVSDPDPSDWECYWSRDMPGLSFQAYVETIDQYPDETFDLILIDGRARPPCFKHSLDKVKRGGHILWDDTTRVNYLPVFKTRLENFAVHDLPGPGPYVKAFHQSSLIRRLR
jgi:hypothetical protein